MASDFSVQEQLSSLPRGNSNNGQSTHAHRLLKSGGDVSQPNDATAARHKQSLSQPSHTRSNAIKPLHHSEENKVLTSFPFCCCVWGCVYCCRRVIEQHSNSPHKSQTKDPRRHNSLLTPWTYKFKRDHCYGCE